MTSSASPAFPHCNLECSLPHYYRDISSSSSSSSSSSPNLHRMASVAAVFVALLALFSGASGLGFEFHHRFSDRVRQWATERDVPGTWWPEKGTADYYTALVHHDRALHGRSLADAGNATELTFSDGNATVRLSSLGFLYYGFVELGTPSVPFFVALDTGSDLFWVPCDCQQCAPTSSPNYGFQNVTFNIFSPSDSSTSQRVTCSDSLCEQSSGCPQPTSTCPYSIAYASANTSSSGILLQDILQLTTEDATPKTVKAPIVFGCGEIQAGSFLVTAAPNGLFGLGRDKISVPSILATKGFTSNSFSMCFGSDNVGRINFGDKGSSDQLETPLVTSVRHPSAYTINITGASVGNDTLGLSFNALVDSGTSFTTLSDPMYTSISESFNQQVQETRHSADSSIPFDYCYDISPTQTTISVPKINLTTEGGSIFHVNHPLVLFSSQGNQVQMYCLAITKTTGINVLGENFLSGLRVVFDRERQVLGWKNFDCYKTESTSGLAVSNSSVTPPAASPGGFTQSESSNKTQVEVIVSPPSSSTGHSLHFSPITSLSLLLLLLCSAII